MIEPHTHNKIDSPPVHGQDIIPTPVISSAPTDMAPNGTIRVYLNGSTYRLYIRANNTWKFKTFDNT